MISFSPQTGDIFMASFTAVHAGLGKDKNGQRWVVRDI